MEGDGMSASVFPALPGLEVESDRTPIYATSVFTTESQVEQRFSHQATPRYRYRLSYTLRNDTMAPAPWQAYTEKAIVQKFVDDHRGEWDSFLIADPWDGVQRRVRFDGLPRFSRVIGGAGDWWEVDIGLVSVLS
jgi:hypothetical protein